MAKKVITNTHSETVVKVWGAAGVSETITLAGLLATGQVLNGATQTVNVLGVSWTGSNENVSTVTRNTDRIFTLPGTGAATLELSGQNMPPDTVSNTYDLVVAITGGPGEVWIKLRKVSGYKTTIEPEQFGPYDNPAVAGS